MEIPDVINSILQQIRIEELAVKILIILFLTIFSGWVVYNGYKITKALYEDAEPY
jgi:hypothetical protein